MVYRFTIAVLWILSKLSVTTQEDFDLDCEYDGDMCKISLENCIAKMEDQGELGECPGIVYGPGMLYDTRDDTPFWIRIKDLDAHSYPPDLTYSITRMTNYKEFSSLSHVPGCCSMNLNESCVLPKKQSSSEVQTIYLPLANNFFGASYCFFELEEARGVLEYCKDENDKGCLEFKDGILHRRSAFLPLSTQHYSPPAEYCFFPTPNEYVDTNGIVAENEIIPRQTAISYSGSGNNITVRMGEDDIECDIVKVKGYKSPVALSADYHDGLSDFVCFFLRAPSMNANWATNPCCIKIKTQGNVTVTVIVATMCSIIAVLVIAIALIWIYKNYLNCTFERNIKELPDTLACKTSEGNIFIGLQKDEDGSCVHPTKEIPDEITFVGLKEDKNAVKPEEKNLLHKKQKMKTWKRYPVEHSEGSIDTPISPGHQDSGFCSDKDVNNEEEELGKAESLVENFDEKLKLELVTVQTNDHLIRGDDDMKSVGVTYDGYTNKTALHANLKEEDVSDQLDKQKKQGLKHFSSPKYDNNDENSSNSVGGSSENLPGYITQVSHHQDGVPIIIPSLDGYVSK